jgi:1-acyl-sn-glycerol-3-phosphate acyltransferase
MASVRLYPQQSANPAPPRGLGAELYRLAGRLWLRLFGWKRMGDWPAHSRFILLAAPHTSNWDGLHMLAAAGAWRVRLKWMGKASLVEGPFGGLVRWAGCIPINRGAAGDVVPSMVKAFADEESLILVIPPEGTRGAVGRWKTGFHRIAREANVPIVFSILDYGTKTVRLVGELLPSDDFDADWPAIRQVYADAEGKHPGRFQLSPGTDPEPGSYPPAPETSKPAPPDNR